MVEPRVDLRGLLVELPEGLDRHQQRRLLHQLAVEDARVLEVETHEEWMCLGQREVEDLEPALEVVLGFVGEVEGQQNGVQLVLNIGNLEKLLEVAELGESRIVLPAGADGAPKQQLHL